MTEQPRLPRDRALWTGLMTAILLAGNPVATLAQVTGDGTLGTQVNGSAIAPCRGTCTVTNGATRGSNLFHSLRQFSLPNGDIANFIIEPTIQTVIVRVTGVGRSFRSTINGTISTNNPANFFLLNPNGILLGPGAALNIGGSFLATTANRMQFADGTEFRTDDPIPLLTIRVPTGLQFNASPKTIQMQGSFLSAGRTDRFSDLALIGGDVTLTDSFVRSPGRQLGLGGVGENGTVNLRLNGDQLNFSLGATTPRRDITLINTNFDSISTRGGGWVKVIGRNIFLDQSSSIAAGILAGADNANTNQAGDITINAAANLHLSRRSLISNPVLPNAIGQGGNVSITASDVRVASGSVISAVTQGIGDAGNVQVRAHTIAIDGTTPNGLASAIRSDVIGSTASSGGGNVIVKTGSLTITNGATLGSSTRGNGNAGKVQIKANTITLDGTTPNGQFGSGIFSQVLPGGNGLGGAITLEVKVLNITHGAAVSASIFGNGNAGKVQIKANTITLDGTAPNGLYSSGIFSQINRGGSGRGGAVIIETGSLTLTNGALVSAITSGNGNAGDVQIRANTIALDGRTPNGNFPTAITSGVNPAGTGRGGNVTIATHSLTITDEAEVSSSAFGNGSAGNLAITAQTIQLDRGGSINAFAFSGNGANLELNIGEVLLMRHNSRISTSAGLAEAGGNGGNITINASRGFLVTAPSENNDITANAFNGSGGRVTINAQGVYWFTPRSRSELVQLLGTTAPAQLDPQRLPTNDMTAISQGNPTLSGTVTLNLLNIDPSRGLVELPANLTDPSQQISQDCTPGSRTAAGSFVATGRGGIPLNPDEPLESRAVVTRWVPLPEEAPEGMSGKDQPARTHSAIPSRSAEAHDPPTAQTPASIASAPIVEAQRFIVGADGGVELVATVPTANSAHFWAACRALPGN